MEIIDNHDPFISDGSATNSYGVGRKLLESAFWPFVAISLIYILVDSLPELFTTNHDKPTGISTLLNIFIAGPICMSTSWVFLKAARREPFKIGDMFSVFKRNYWKAVGGYILKTLLIILGFFLLVVPGIILIVRLSFVEFLIIDRNMGPLEAVRESWDMTHGHGWTIFGMLLLAIPVILLGLLCLLVGVVVSMAWLFASSAVFYLTASSDAPSYETDADFS